jgi:alkaline phosphatase
MKNKTISLVLIAFIVLTGFTGAGKSGSAPSPKRPRNIILFIGDGMGLAQVYAAMTVSDRPLNLEKFQYTGFSKTYSADSYVTDSGAGGTAIACGVKTNNGMIGVRPDSTTVRSIIEIAHQNGLSTGILSTSAVTHATPASFIAHNAGRGNYEDIAKDFLSGNADVFIGGGEDHFRARKDSADLAQNLKQQGFDVVYTLSDLKKSGSSKIAGLLAREHMPTVLEGRGSALAEMTRKAIETLSGNDKGFIMMVEGSMIDWGAHDQNIDYVVSEVRDLDEAVGVALDYSITDGNTLVVVTADHETGGITLNGGDLSKHSVEAKFSGGGHTGIMVPVYASGPGSEKFSGIHENTFFFGIFKDLLRLKQ